MKRIIIFFITLFIISCSDPNVELMEVKEKNDQTRWAPQEVCQDYWECEYNEEYGTWWCHWERHCRY